MNPTYLPGFVELFASLTGISTKDAVVGGDGWLFIPPEVDLEEKDQDDRKILGVLGWRNDVADDASAGWWVNPWPNIEEQKFIALTLSEEGATSFSYLQNGKPGDRHAYFVHHINTGNISGAPMLLGQFLFEFEGCPSEALRMGPGGTNRIYYPRDKRVSAYGPLTAEEERDVQDRLHRLAKRYPAKLEERARVSAKDIERLAAAV